jgi:hypothetical protein
MKQHRINRLAFLIVLLGLVLWQPYRVAAQQPELTLAEYESNLRAARTAAARGDRLDLEEIAARITPTVTVITADGMSLRVDNRWLSDALATPNPNFPALAAQLGALIDAFTYVGAPAPPDALDRLNTILTSPPFGQPDTGPREPNAFDRFLEWLVEWLFGNLPDIAPLPAVEPAARTADTASWLVVLLGVLLVAGVLWLWLRTLRRTLTPPLPPRPLSDDPEANLSPADARAQASALAAQGDYRNASRLLYLSALLWLDERRVLRYDRHLTNREYLNRLADRPALRSRMQPVVETFDRVWYGKQPLDAAGFAEYERQIGALREDGSPNEAPRS